MSQALAVAESTRDRQRLLTRFATRDAMRRGALPRAPADGDAAGVPGVRVVRDFVDEATEARWLRAIDARAWSALSQRRVQHYGYAFDYAHNNVDLRQPLAERPAFFVEALDRAHACCGAQLLPQRFDQLTVNEYNGGADQIAPHTDTHHAFGDPILSVSLGSHTVMEFRLPPPLAASSGVQPLPNVGQRIEVYLPPRSLLIMSGESRYAWTHAIRHRSTDMVDGRILQRGRRVSLTFRSVRQDPVRAFARCTLRSFSFWWYSRACANRRCVLVRLSITVRRSWRRPTSASRRR